MRVTLLSDGNYEIVEDHATKVVALQDLSALLNTVVTKPYIAQKYIKSCLSSGIPFDVRIHVRRNKQAQWDIVKTYVRIGLAKMLTSNVAGGGGVADAQTFLRSHLGKTLGDRTYRRLEEIGITLPPRLQRARMMHNIDALGIDVGIESDGGMYFFEINTFPGAKFFYLEDAIAVVDYARTLALNPDLAFPEV